jgi:hypothetical protein
MKKSSVIMLGAAVALVMSMGLASCASSKTFEPKDWSEYVEPIPSKEYTALGILVFNADQASSPTLITDMMVAAKKMGGDDIINVRLDQKVSGGKETTVGAVATVIKYGTTMYLPNQLNGFGGETQTAAKAKKGGIFSLFGG